MQLFTASKDRLRELYHVQSQSYIAEVCSTITIQVKAPDNVFHTTTAPRIRLWLGSRAARTEVGHKGVAVPQVSHTLQGGKVGRVGGDAELGTEAFLVPLVMECSHLLTQQLEELKDKKNCCEYMRSVER